jgi:MSHA biogenesis protein MshJ
MMLWWKKKPIIDVVKAYDGISAREQKVILLGVVSTLALLFFMLLIEPLFIRHQNISSEYDTVVVASNKLKAQLEETLTRKFQDPNIPLRVEIASLEERNQKLDEDISRLTKALVAPKQMVFLLESMLKSDKEMKLISLLNLPKEDVTFSLEKEQNAVNETDETEEGVIYKHAFEIEMEATYDSTVNYLRRIDNLEWKVFWQQLDFEVKHYPSGILKIKIYTLSTSKEVLGV